ncbi:MAG TPA: adenine deaminase [Bacillales bacterium]|nr:adenine deaminase [Bacillales bacterium]
MEEAQLKKRIAAAAKQIPADLVVKNGKIVDVLNQEIISADLAITDGVIVGIGDYEGETIIDAEDRFIAPGLIDGHVHIESAMIPPSEFAKVVVPHGVTTVIADPHEIANVSGADGIQYMLDDSEGLPLNVLIALPSCVPATPFENAGASLDAEQLKPFYNHERVIGLGEVMDFPSVRNGDNTMMEKLLDAENAGKSIDGHAAGLSAEDLNIYMTSGIRTDHEATTAEEARERLKRGMYLMIREGSVAKDLDALIGVVNEKNARRCLFVTDDKHLDDLMEEGSIDHNIRLAIQRGVDPILAIQMATLNTAECFGLKRKGLLAPGYYADFLLLDDLDTFTINSVYSKGKLVAEKRSYLGENNSTSVPNHLKNSVNLGEIHNDQLQIKMKGPEAHIIKITPNSLVTEHEISKVEVVEGNFQPSTENDLLKLAVIERHHRTGNIGLGIVKGFGLETGAIATTIAHDSHNLVVTGTNDEDMLTAIHKIKDIHGGIAVAKNGKILAAMPLSIAGLMSDENAEAVKEQLKILNESLSSLGFDSDFNPFLTLSFLALPVIPQIKLTDLGLFDVQAFRHLDIDAT